MQFVSLPTHIGTVDFPFVFPKMKKNCDALVLKIFSMSCFNERQVF